MDVTNPYQVIWIGAMHRLKSYECHGVSHGDYLSVR
jgi:hypothetical protein